MPASLIGRVCWRERAPSGREIDNAVLSERIRAVHAASDATYGMPRVRAEQIDQGVAVQSPAGWRGSCARATSIS